MPTLSRAILPYKYGWTSPRIRLIFFFFLLEPSSERQGLNGLGCAMSTKTSDELITSGYRVSSFLSYRFFLGDVASQNVFGDLNPIGFFLCRVSIDVTHLKKNDVNVVGHTCSSLHLMTVGWANFHRFGILGSGRNDTGKGHSHRAITITCYLEHKRRRCRSKAILCCCVAAAQTFLRRFAQSKLHNDP